MSVVFLNRTRNQGGRGVVGPVTLIKYNIVPDGTPVSELDADELLAMTEDPCCGHELPFGGKVKSFGVHTPTKKQLDDVPDFLWDAEPIVGLEERPRRRKAKTYEKPEPIVEPGPLEFEEPTDDKTFAFLYEETKEEVSEEVT